jgi:hypothetical protein
MCKQTIDRCDRAMIVVMVRKRTAGSVSDADRILDGVDKRMHEVDTGRRADILVSLPAMLAALVPVMLAGGVAVVALLILTMPVVVKIARKL